MTTYDELVWLLFCVDETRIADPDASGNSEVAWEMHMADINHDRLAVGVMSGSSKLDEEQRRCLRYWSEKDPSIWVTDYGVEVELSPWPELLEHARWLRELTRALADVGDEGPVRTPPKTP
jgi:hypothetical protein